MDEIPKFFLVLNFEIIFHKIALIVCFDFRVWDFPITSALAFQRALCKEALLLRKFLNVSGGSLFWFARMRM